MRCSSTRSWLATTTQRAVDMKSVSRLKAAALKASSATEIHSSITTISGRKLVPTAKASRATMPCE